MITGLLAAALLLGAAPADPQYLFADSFNHGLRSEWSVRGTDYEEGMTHARGSRRAVSVSNGMLHLRVLADGGNYLNGHIGTEGRFEFAYGWAAARIRFSPFAGSHGAFWLLAPKAVTDFSGVEVDVAEDFGANRPNRKRGVEMHHNVWYLPLIPGNPLEQITRTTNSTEFSRWHEEFHTFAVHWTPTRYAFYIDSVRVATIFGGLNATPRFLVLSLLTRDWEIPDLLTHNLDTYEMDVDWVRVWRQATTLRLGGLHDRAGFVRSDWG